ncbi:MAG: YgiT-type zinc finger protein [Candidatus Bipolaricaulia bacterium]
MAKSQEQVCPVCGAPLKETQVTHDETWGDKLYRFEKVPALICTEYGEVLFSAEVNEILEEIITSQEEPDHYQEVKIPVFNFTKHLPEKTAA